MNIIKPKQNYDETTREAARRCYENGMSIREITEHLGIALRTAYNWQKKDNWHEKNLAVEDAIRQRLILLAGRDSKTDKDYSETERLTTQLLRLTRREHCSTYTKNSRSSVGDRKRGNQTSKSAAKKRNDLSHLVDSDFSVWKSRWYRSQHELHAAMHYRNRFVLKSRQIGATWYFAQEALMRALQTGEDQIFLSATRRQAEVFRTYIIKLVSSDLGIELTGNPIIINSSYGKCGLYFLSNNALAAQSQSGHVYIDEVFWIRNFDELYNVATAMATHSHYTRTLVSTPSAVNHPAYALWSGELYNRRYKRKKRQFPTFSEMQQGALCPDQCWRKIITLDDAIKGGFDRVDRAMLEEEYTPERFMQLFKCVFIDDTLGVFRLQHLQDGCVDPDCWIDFDPQSDRPLGDAPVLCGYDPSRYRDDASFVVVADPLQPGGVFRLLEKHHWTEKNFTWQAEQIRQITNRYNVCHIGVDTTGPGMGVFDLITAFFPRAQAIHYSINVKNMLVQKAKSVVEAGRLEYPAHWTELAHAFLTIRQTSTNFGSMTYTAGRTGKTGHADLAWAVMHALMHEPLDTNQNTRSCVAYSE